MTDIQELEIVVKALSEKKAEKLTALKVEDITSLANYFVIAGASSTTQAKALADYVEFKLGEKDIKPKNIEGTGAAGWIVLDYIDVVVHIFTEEQRDFYRLENLWADGKIVDISAWE